jgi:hypothetical protein
VQRADDVHSLLEHVLPLRHGRPALAGDVLVEVLAGAEAEDEPAVGQELHGGRLLRDDRRVVALDRAGDVGRQFHPRRGVRHGAQHRPRVRRVALLCQPGRVMVTGDLEVEADLLGPYGVPDQILRPALLRHQRVSEPDQRSTASPAAVQVAARTGASSLVTGDATVVPGRPLIDDAQ